MLLDRIRRMFRRSPRAGSGANDHARDALRQSNIKVGDEVEGEVVELRPNSVGLDLGGARGWVSGKDLGLREGEVEKRSYRVGARLRVSVEVPNPDGSFNCKPLIKVGDEVEGEVVELRPNSVGLDLGGARGWVSAQNLGFRRGEVERGPYRVGARLRVSVAGINPDGSFNCKPVADIDRRLGGGPPSPEARDVAAEIEVGTVVPARVEAHAADGGLKVSANGLQVVIPPDELAQCANDLTPDLLEPGDIVAAFVFEISRDKRHLKLSLRRAASSWVGVLARFEGTAIDARIVSAMDWGLVVDADGVPGWIARSHLLLSPGQDVKAHFRAGDSVRAMVIGVDGQRRQALLSVWAAEIEVGTVVPAHVEAHVDDGGLKVSVNGLSTVVPPDELAQCANDLRLDLLEPGDIVAAFVLAVDRTKKQLELSLRRAAPARVNMLRSLSEVLRKLSENEEPPIVPGSVLEIDTKSMSMLVSVNGIAQWVPKIELPSGATTTSLESYVGGSPIDVYVCEVDLDRRDIVLSMRRADPEWRATLDSLVPEQAVSGTIALADRTRGLAIDLGPVAAWVAWSDVPRSEGPYRNWIRRIGQTVFGHVKAVDRHAGDAEITLLRATKAADDLLREGDVVVGEVTGYFRDGPGLHVAVWPVEGGVGSRGIPVAFRTDPRSEYRVGQQVRVSVREIDGTAGDWVWFSIDEAPLDLSDGQEVTGVIDSVTDLGYWVSLQGTSRRNPRVFLPQHETSCDVGGVPAGHFDLGQSIVAVVAKRNDGEEMHLSMRKLSADLARRLEDVHVGAEMSGRVVRTGPKFAFVDLGPVDARVRVSEQSLKPDSRMGLTVGETVSVIVTYGAREASRGSRPIEASIRRADPEWKEAANRIGVDTVIDGIIQAVMSNILLVDIGPLSGSVSREELPIDDGARLQDHYRVGDQVRVLVMWTDIEKATVALSIGRAAPYKYGQRYPRFLIGLTMDALCEELNDAEAAFALSDLDATGWKGKMWTSEFSLEPGGLPDFNVGDNVRVVVIGRSQHHRVLYLSRRRIDDRLWRESLARLTQGSVVPGVVRDIDAQNEAGLRVDVGPTTDWVAAHETSLDPVGPGWSAEFSIGQGVSVYVISQPQFDQLGKRNPRFELSLRRASDGWSDAATRIQPGSLGVGTVLPELLRDRMSGGAARVELDLGPVSGVCETGELSGADAAAFISEKARAVAPIVVKTADRGDGKATVSLAEYADRWRELVRELGVETDEKVSGRVARLDGVTAIVDLGHGLMCQVSSSEFNKDDQADGGMLGDRVGVWILEVSDSEHAIVGSLRPSRTEAQQRVTELLQARESKRVEFKPGLRKIEGAKRDMEFEVLKNIVAFLNAEGGDLLIGVTDAGEPKGLVRGNRRNADEAQQHLGDDATDDSRPTEFVRDDWEDIDKAQQLLTQRIHARIDSAYWPYIHSECVRYDELDLLLVTITPLPREHILAWLVVDSEKKVFARVGSSAYALEETTEVLKYQLARMSGTDYEIPDSDGPAGMP